MTIAIAKTLDVKGLACPIPIVKTAQAMRQLEGGVYRFVLQKKG